MKDYAADKNLLKDKIILVTGAGAGIGKEASLTYARHGATVILLGKTIHKLEQVYDQIEHEGGAQPAIYPMDLAGASGKDFEDLAVNIENEFSRLDGLLHNAAQLGSLRALSQFDMESWTKIMQVNLHAPFVLTQVCLPLLAQSENASLVFTADDVGKQGKAYWGAYAISKAASDNMMQVFADELEINSKIRVNSINPGKVATKMRSGVYPGEDPNSIAQTADIMPAYLYLMGDDSKDLNGQVIAAQ